MLFLTENIELIIAAETLNLQTTYQPVWTEDEDISQIKWYSQRRE